MRNKKFVIIALTIIFLLTNNHKLKADYINLTGAQLSSTIAEYYVDDDGITLKLEIGERDQGAFRKLIDGDEDGSGNDRFAMDVWMQNPLIGFNFHF